MERKEQTGFILSLVRLGQVVVIGWRDAYLAYMARSATLLGFPVQHNNMYARSPLLSVCSINA